MDDLESLRTLCSTRIGVVLALRQAQADKRVIDEDIARKVFNVGLHDCLTVNWNRLGHVLRMPVE